MPETFSLEDARHYLRAPGPTDDKYSRGVLGLVVGSEDYPGAAVLSAEAALASGVGMVRLVTSPTPQQLVLEARPEVVIAPGRVDALVVGSGMAHDSSQEIHTRLGGLDIASTSPVVVDAGALAHTPQLPGHKVLTPHLGEIERLAGFLGLGNGSPKDYARDISKLWGVVVFLKGHVSTVITPEGDLIELPEATAWLATAGTGDVLAGLMGALLAQQKSSVLDSLDLARIAASAGVIHAEAALRVSQDSGGEHGGPITARDVARAISRVIASLLD